MNDWLDYKGSGSSRACMGDTILHGLFEDQINYKQHAADRRLLESKKEQLSSLEIDTRNAELNAQAMSKRILDSEKLKKKYEAELSKIQSEYKALRTDEPLKAHQKFAESEWAYKEYVKYMDDKIAKEKAKWSEYSNLHSKLKSKMIALQQEIIKLEKSLSR